MNLSLEGRNIVVMGVANKRSIAWGIARSLHNAGARLIFTYAGERLEKSVKELADSLERNDSIVLPCDVTNDQEIEACFADIKKEVGVIHGIAHCIAFANKEDLAGEYLNTTRDGFLLAHNISSYSLTAVAKAARGIMTEGGSIVTLTYLGGERVVSNYNVMGVAKASLDASVKYLASDLGKDGIRVNSISAGPIRTLSAKGISDFNSILKEIEERAPLRRTTTPEEVGDTAAFLFSDLSRGMTGENLHVDSGYHIIAR
ncbi:enoyl-ACP reductase FabI [Bacillus sp. GM2]|jgi:enoyl-[acyl-carrier protein] reductase I|uniref:Enoyl-[acyl-carrier-protein] reductase [NADH] n=4 Tax=Bacillus TaxID=1386 RepID=Q65L91_BACLD|nr:MULTISPECIES: enoyl-ACP reductase FabI [Bacillus]ETB70964.1 enoyl-ACP reductase [Bacillus sp. CPSM8]KJD52888.1 enoyl-ACP reductase [Bacillus amyloliquefaciens]KUL12406.1 enoyl-ACP reductase [Bacillus licheniformis LMG 7559]KUL18461.1 enoyl-ACP reductase [Bacillus licheniformis LMG 6934]MBC8622154.1 enoyl-ACP reductase FabI [Robertmurraya crescens]MBJ7888710.1 enoyl-ACP reductase FabI [Bacillaceae bacterium HSR45]MBY8349754.1 enoyl-[acyl-carrier-protein] reductase FabI [Bacillus sp. PCH94]